MVNNSSVEMANHTNNSNVPSIELLEFQQFLDEDIPAVVFLAILSIVGTVGNIHTLLGYSLSETFAKVAVRNFILWLSAIDLTACVMCMPFEMIEVRFNYTFSSAGACKFFRFLAYTVSIGSGGLLAAIAIERYTINAKRLPKVNAKPSVVVNTVSAIIVGISVVLSIPALVLYGLEVKETDFDGVNGSDCMITSEYKTMTTAGIYSGFVFLTTTLYCVICCFAYGYILFTIYKRTRRERERMKSDCNQIKPHTNSNQTKSSSDSNQTKCLPDMPSSEGEVMSPINQTRRLTQNIELQQRDIIHQTKAERGNYKFDKGIQLTVSLIVATAVSYFGYIIFVLEILIAFADPEFANRFRPIGELLMRLNFLTNAVNPVVFCLIDNKFRAECLNLYRRTNCGKKWSNV